MAYVAGFGGGRERGIQMLQETAAAGGENRTDAMFALVLVYNRERRYDDALRVLQELRQLYPRNRLVLLEAGSTALRAGRAEQAEAVLTEGLGMLASDDAAREFPAKKRSGATSEAPRGSRSAASTRRAPTCESATAPRRRLGRGRARVELGAGRAAARRSRRGRRRGATGGNAVPAGSAIRCAWTTRRSC